MCRDYLCCTGEGAGIAGVAIVLVLLCGGLVFISDITRAAT